jgi:hypothetical protein
LLFVSLLAPDRTPEAKAKYIAKIPAAKRTSLPSVWGAKIVVLPLSASSAIGGDAGGLIYCFAHTYVT